MLSTRRQVETVVLFGGGIDAGAMVELYRPVENLYLLYFDYGAKAATGEIAALRYFMDKYLLPGAVVQIDPQVFPPNPITNAAMTDDHKDDYLPGRNMVLAALAFPIAVKLGAKRIYLGAAPLPPGDPMIAWARDMQQPFVNRFNHMTDFAYGSQHPVPELVAPLLRFKHKAIYTKLALRTEPRLFEVTTSCYQSKTLVPCGRCAHCLYRVQLRAEVAALEAAPTGMEDGAYGGFVGE